MKLPQQCNIYSENQRFCGRTFFNLRSFQQNFNRHFDFCEESDEHTVVGVEYEVVN